MGMVGQRRGATESANAAAINQRSIGSYPRPTNGILVAITVMKSTLASSGRLAM